MAFALSKQQTLELDRFRRDFVDLRTIIVGEYTALNDALRKLADRYNQHVRLYNALVTKFETFADEIAEEHRDAYDERSEGWQASDRGLAAEDFVATWESVAIVELDHVELLMPDEPDFGALSDLDRLPCAAD